MAYLKVFDAVGPGYDDPDSLFNDTDFDLTSVHYDLLSGGRARLTGALDNGLRFQAMVAHAQTSPVLQSMTISNGARDALVTISGLAIRLDEDEPDFDNIFRGSDEMVGSRHADHFEGESGNDTLRGQAGRDDLRGDSGHDRLYGGSGNDRLLGGTGHDRLEAGTGQDRLDGGAGRDELVGGTDKPGDDFVFVQASHSRPGAEHDTIRNFTSKADDIDLSGIDARAGGGDNAFVWSGHKAAHNAVWWVDSAKGALLRADVNHDAKADFEVLLAGVHHLDRGDMVL